MHKNLPEINLEIRASQNIEVMSFEDLYLSLSNSNDHDPFSPHIINFYLILYVNKKVYSHFVDFKLFTLNEGSSLFVAKNQIHHFNRDIKNSEGYAVVFNHLFIDKFYFLTDNLRLNRLFNYHIESPVIEGKDMANDNLNDLIGQMYFEYKRKSTFAKAEIIASLLRVLLLKSERLKELKTTSNISNHWLEIFNRFKDMLTNTYTESRSSRFYAQKLLISYKLLNEVVKKLTGKTVKAFIDEYVSMEIKRYLISSSLSVNEISYKTGFDVPANMVKFFKKHNGTTPLKFRKHLSQ